MTNDGRRWRDVSAGRVIVGLGSAEGCLIGWKVALGAGAAVLGHPAAAIAMLVNHLGRRGEALPAGTLVMSGGVTEAIAVAAGDHVCLRVQGCGSTSMRFVD